MWVWVGTIPWRRKWQPTPAFLPGKSHGQRDLVGYSPWVAKSTGHYLATKQQQQQEKASWVKQTPAQAVTFTPRSAHTVLPSAITLSLKWKSRQRGRAREGKGCLELALCPAMAFEIWPLLCSLGGTNVYWHFCVGCCTENLTYSTSL